MTMSWLVTRKNVPIAFVTRKTVPIAFVLRTISQDLGFRSSGSIKEVVDDRV